MTSFEQFYDQYIDKVYQFVFYKVGNKNDTQDIVSEIFMKAYKKFDTYDTNKGSMKTWIYTIAQNTCIDWIKTKKSYEPYEWINEQEYKEDMLQRIQNKQQIEAVLQFLDGIDLKHKQIVMMKIWDNMSYEEISEIVNISPSAAKQIFYRTMQKITQRFGILIAISLVYGL